MHFFLIRETLSFILMYVAACYPVGTTISKTSSLFTALLQDYQGVHVWSPVGKYHKCLSKPFKKICCVKENKLHLS